MQSNLVGYVDSNDCVQKLHNLVISETNVKHIIMQDQQVARDSTFNSISSLLNNTSEILNIRIINDDYKTAREEMNSALNNPNYRIIICAVETGLAQKSFDEVKVHFIGDVQLFHLAGFSLNNTLINQLHTYFNFEYLNPIQTIMKLKPEDLTNNKFYDFFYKAIRIDHGYDRVVAYTKLVQNDGELKRYYNRGNDLFKFSLEFDLDKLHRSISTTFYWKDFTKSHLYAMRDHVNLKHITL